MPRGTQVKRDGLAIIVEKEGHLKWDCPQASKPPQLPVLSAKDLTGEEIALQGVGPRGQTLKTIGLEVLRGSHTSSCPSNT